MINLALTLVALACAADAHTTNRLIKRGGHEKVAAWLVGKYPSTLTCWLTFFVLPVGVVAWGLQVAPAVWPLAIVLALLRAYFAIRNHGLSR